MRIALISPEFPLTPGGGGIGTYTATMGAALARGGHEVTVLTRAVAEEREVDGVRLLPVDPRWLPQRDAERMLAARTIARAARATGADVVQAPEWGAEAWWIARRGTLPLVTRLATPTYLVDRLNDMQPDPATRGLRRMERAQALRSDALVAPSATIARRVASAWGLDPARIEVIPNPIDARAVRSAAAQEPPVELPGRFLGFVGRLEHRKGVGVLAEALPDVLGSHPDVHAVFVGRDAGSQGGGAGRSVEELAARFPDRVHVLGELHREDALAVIGRAEIVVLPSLWEAFGFVATEALALERPVVATSGSGFAEIIEHGESGWLVPPGEPSALSSTIAAALEDPQELRRISQGAGARARDFDADELGQRVARVYERVVAGPARGGTFDSGIYTSGYRRFFRPEDRSNPFSRIYEHKRQTVLSHCMARPRMDLVDVGCGPGRLVVPLSARHRVTGTDISADMLAECRARAGESVRLVQADARELPFADAEFDGLIALDLLPHLQDLDAALAELSRVVRPGGFLILDTSNASPWWVPAYPAYVNYRPRRLLATMRRSGVLPEWSAIVRHHRADEVRDALERSGLGLEHVQPFGPPWTPKWHLWFTSKPA